MQFKNYKHISVNDIRNRDNCASRSSFRDNEKKAEKTEHLVTLFIGLLSFTILKENLQFALVETEFQI